jgi:hypothetical protein
LKNHAILIATALLLAGCSAPAAAPAESASAVATPASAGSTSVAATAASAAPSVAPAAASGPRLSTPETCAAIDRFYRPAKTATEAERLAAMDAVAAEMKTLPERASDELKAFMPPIVAFSEVALKDAKANTRELDKYMADPAVAKPYQEAVQAAAKFCPQAAPKK